MTNTTSQMRQSVSKYFWPCLPFCTLYKHTFGHLQPLISLSVCLGQLSLLPSVGYGVKAAWAVVCLLAAPLIQAWYNLQFSLYCKFPPECNSNIIFFENRSILTKDMDESMVSFIQLFICQRLTA